MAWLIAHIWVALSIAAIFGLLFGFSLRGLTGANRVRRAEVDRDVAKTELRQVKNDLDVLYAAQRKTKEDVPTDTPPRGDDERVIELQQALAARDDEIQKLRNEANTSDDTDIAARNDWLETRIVELEKLVEAKPAAPVEDDSKVAMLETEKAELADRIEALESELSNTKAVPVPAPTAVGPDVEEELAKLRWRNRYLEGRLAYFEEGTAEEETALEEASTGEGKPSDLDTTEDRTTGPAPENVTPIHPSEAVLEQLLPVGDAEQPPAQSPPGSGGDDLTAITGIGPRIADVLNELGIWTYAQIAAWTPENALWVDGHLAFKGRVAREAWIAQAADLSNASAEAV